MADANDKAIACNQVYDSVVENELALTPWRFAMKKVQLARLTDTPANEWKYAFQLPTDRIGAPFAVFNTPSVGVNPVKNFEVFADKIYTNELALYVDYPFKPAVSAWPAYFVEFVVLAITSLLAVPITDQRSLAEHYDVLAYGLPSDNRAGGQLARARYADAAQQPPQVMEDNTLVDVRN